MSDLQKSPAELAPAAAKNFFGGFMRGCVLLYAPGWYRSRFSEEAPLSCWSVRQRLCRMGFHSGLAKSEAAQIGIYVSMKNGNVKA